MGFRDLVPWTRNQQLTPARDAFDPFWTLHREMNRLFDDAFRGFGSLGRVGSPLMDGQFSWPRLELSETDKTVTVSAELPGLTEQDVQVEIANGVLSIRGEKKAERNDESKFVTERYYGSFERQIPLEGIEEEGQGGFQERRPDCDASEIRAVEPERQTYRGQFKLKLGGGGIAATAFNPVSH